MAGTEADVELATGGEGSRAVLAWLYVLTAMVFLMVVIGGATRLTDSGLSITEWKPIVGIVPPLTDAAWHDVFEKYKQIPEYHIVNRGMSLEAFKAIFWWEWGHRFLGRIIGIVFFIPFVWFMWTRRIPRYLAPRLIALFLLGGLQGAIGWYMVRSGLVDRVDVSHYRLAVHLGVAVVILGLLLWTALDFGGESRATTKAAVGAPQYWTAVALVALIFLQVLLGALVAGLKAGLSHNTWPLMDGALIPSGLGAMSPWYLNVFENVLTVQFNHRMVAYAIAAVTLWQVVSIWRSAVSTGIRYSADVLGLGVLAQIVLGIWTLLAQVPLSLGLAHQAGAAVVFSLAVWHLHRIVRA
ncbi:MAG: COX15/CtaA family protein [Hyphomicrobiaceae bacterium]